MQLLLQLCWSVLCNLPYENFLNESYAICLSEFFLYIDPGEEEAETETRQKQDLELKEVHGRHKLKIPCRVRSLILECEWSMLSSSQGGFMLVSS